MFKVKFWNNQDEEVMLGMRKEFIFDTECQVWQFVSEIEDMMIANGAIELSVDDNCYKLQMEV